MILIKQDFKDLSIVELLQNIWCYCKRTNELTERGEQIPYFYFFYQKWNEDICLAKWDRKNLPSFCFVLCKIKKGKQLFCPGSAANAENYFNFLCGLKNVMRNIIQKQYTKKCYMKCCVRFSMFCILAFTLMNRDNKSPS